jgi:hypothetical protein
MRDDQRMRTTLDIDDDVMEMAKQLAAYRRTTAGKALSELARKGMASGKQYEIRNGVPVIHTLPPGAPKHTLEDVNRIRDEE